MGIHFFRNAAAGGDWIIQSGLKNATWLNKLLPDRAPLSTMRVITASTFPIRNEMKQEISKDGPGTFITVFSSVLRLGRAGASTDHSAVFFDVDKKTVIFLFI